VVRTTDSWVRSFAHVTSLLSMSSDSRVWVPGPASSTMNLFAAVHATFVDARLVADPATATHAHLTPAALSRALRDGPNLAGVHAVVAGDRLTQGLSRQASEAGVRVSHYYGAAELSFVAWGAHEADLRPFPEVEIMVRDGSLWVRSPFICEGYDGPAGPFTVDGDGFATVGDRGSIADGFVQVLGRGDHAVTTGGATVHVADVEAALRPAVEGELVVIGLSHAELGQVVTAVLTDASGFDAARCLARSSLPPSHRPRLWFQLGSLPLTEAGKVDRAGLARLLVSRDHGARPLT
jgi:long-chain acyl-CoA synthetase